MFSYYYSNGRPEEEMNESHTTLFMKRPDDVEVKLSVLKKFVHAVTPPIVADAIRSLRRQIKP